MIGDYQRYRYERHCIQEAIFEAKFSTENFDSTVPGQFYEKVRHAFPSKNDLKKIIISLGAAQSDSPPIAPQSPTMQAWNDQRTQCLQLGEGIISANILDHSYQSWENFEQAINLLINSYLQSTQPINANRVGVRYINRFVFPEENIKISDYFNLDLSIPDLFKNLNAFGFNIVNNYQHSGYNITTLVKFSSDALKINEKGVAFILDIDSFVINGIPVESTGISNIANVCHDYLKAIFESVLKDKTRSLLGGVKI